MDLPTCPACGQSVLDDDAQDCPFCGAPMKGGAPGKPAAKAPAKPASKTSPAAKGAAGSAQGAGAGKPLPAVNKPAAREKPKSDDDDPFGVDQDAAANAIPVSPKPGGGRTLEVVCPMCETAGYISPKAAGKAIKCHNPQCMVPIFTAPVIEKEEAPPPPPPKSKMPIYVGGGVAAVALIAGGLWLAPGGDPGKKKPGVVPVAPVSPGLTNTTPDPDNPPPDNSSNAKKNSEPKVPVAKSRDELIRDALRDLVEAAQTAPTNRKPFCRRLAGIAYASAGDMKAAEDQVQRTGAATGHEGLLPLVAIAWKQLTVRQPAEFKKTIAAAQAREKQLPPRGRYAVEAAIALAAALVADGRAADARATLAAHRGGVATETVAAALLIVDADGSFNFDRPLIGRTLGEWQFPLETAVTLILSAHGRWDDAQTWATKAADPALRTECTLVWAEALAMYAAAASLPQELERAIAAGEDLPPVGKARLFARLAAVQFAGGDRGAADGLVSQAQAALAAIKVPPPLKIEGMRQLLELKLPDPVLLRLAALAAGDIALVQLQLGQAEPAWTNLQTGLAFLRGATPSPAYLQKQVKDIDAFGADNIRLRLKESLALTDDDQARRAFTNYKARCGELLAAANDRFRRQFLMLAAATDGGLLDPVWTEIQTLSTRPNLSDQEPFLETTLPGLIAARYEAAGNTDQRNEVRAAVPANVKIADPLPLVRDETRRMVDAGEATKAVQQINASAGTSDVLDEWSLRLASRLVAAGKYSEALLFLSGLKDVIVREEGLQLATALAARNGHAEKFRAAAAEKISAPTEKAAVCAGVVQGLTRVPPVPPPAAAPEAPAKKAG